MLKILITNAVVAKGYNGAPAVKFNDKNTLVRFRVGCRVYDRNAENNTRWINLAVRAFGQTCERISAMQLTEGSRLNIDGKLDEEVWEDETTHEKHRQYVVIATSVEFCGSKPDSAAAPQNPSAAGGYSGTSQNAAYGGTPQTPQNAGAYGAAPQMPQNAAAYNGTPQNGSYGATPMNAGGYGAAPQNDGYGAAPGNFTGYEGYGAPGSGNAFYG